MLPPSIPLASPLNFHRVWPVKRGFMDRSAACMRNKGCTALLGLLVFSASAWADSVEGQAGSPVTMNPPLPIVDAAPVPVDGLKSGPGLWQVRKGGNTLWIFSTVSPIPKGLEWYSPQAERALARSR